MNAANTRRPLDLIAALLRALSHKIRTPLSVISNDLNVIKSHGFTDECTRDLAKVNQISELLRRCTTAVLASSAPSRLTLEQLAKKLGGIELRLAEGDAGQPLTIDAERLNTALHFIADTLGAFAPKGSFTAEPFPVQCQINAARDLQLRIERPFTSFAAIEQGKRFDTFTELFSRSLDSDLPWPALADAILWDMGAAFTGEIMGAVIVIEIRFAGV